MNLGIQETMRATHGSVLGRMWCDARDSGLAIVKLPLQRVYHLMCVGTCNFQRCPVRFYRDFRHGSAISDSLAAE